MAGFFERLGARKSIVQQGAPQEGGRPQPTTEPPLRAIHHHARIAILRANTEQWPANRVRNDELIAWHSEQITTAPKRELEELQAALSPRQRRP